MRGTFEVISLSDDGQQLVALETGWKKDATDLALGLADFAAYCEVGVDDMAPNVIHACMDGDIWRRCRIISRDGSGGFVVDLIDRGGSITVGHNNILMLSQIYKDWAVRSVDIIFLGYSINSGSWDKGELEKILFNKSFHFVYAVERTSPHHRDRIFITEIKHEGNNILDALMQNGFLKKQARQQQQQENERPFSQQTNCARPPRQERAPLRPQRPITKPGSGPQRFDRRSGPPHEGDETQPGRREGRPLRGNSPQQPRLPQSQKKRTPPVQSVRDDVFSSAGDWSEPPMKKESPNINELPQRVEKLHININGPDNSADKCEKCIRLANKVNTLESSLYGATVQKLIASRLANIFAELQQIKLQLTRLRLGPVTQENGIARNGLTHYRREGRVRVEEAGELLQTATSETLASFRMNEWAQFVGVIWKPMMDLQYLDERPLCVYKGTVIRRVVLEDNVQSEGVALSQQQPPPPKASPERVTVVLERAIEIPRMFLVLQDLAPDRAQGRVHSVFFSEDNSKVFIQLECPQSAEEDLEEFAKSTIAILNERHIID